TGFVWLLTAAVVGDVSAFVVGVLNVLFAAFILIEYRTSGTRPVSAIATRAAIVTECAVFGAATIEPVLAIPLTMAALIPAVLALAYAERRTVIRLMIAGGLVGTWSAIASHVLPWRSSLIAPLDVILPVGSLVLAYGVFLIFLLN